MVAFLVEIFNCTTEQRKCRSKKAGHKERQSIQDLITDQCCEKKIFTHRGKNTLLGNISKILKISSTIQNWISNMPPSTKVFLGDPV